MKKFGTLEKNVSQNYLNKTLSFFRFLDYFNFLKKHVIVNNENSIIGYVAIIDEIEPAYTAIEGKWLNDDPYIVMHRLAVAQDIVIKGLGTWTMQEIEKIALVKNIHSIKVDTNFDNIAMLRVFDKLGYIYCGEVNFGGGIRKAFQKIL